MPATVLRPRRALDWAYRQAYRLGFPVMRVYWHVRRPAHQGTQVAIWVGGQVLCVRQSYRPGLSFPGGGVAAGERPEEAARRELREELGLCVAPAQLRCVLQASGVWDGRRETVWFYEMDLMERPEVRLDRREIVAAAFMAPDDLARLPLAAPVAAYLRWRG